MSIRLAGPARVAIAAVLIVVGAAACGSDDPGAERSDPAVDTSTTGTSTTGTSTAGDGVTSSTATPDRSTTAAVDSGGTPTTTDLSTPPDTMTSGDVTADGMSTTIASELGVSEAEVIELEQQLDEIDRVLADIEEQLAQD